MGYSFAAGTTDGPGEFDFTQVGIGSNTKTLNTMQGVITGNPFWDFISGLLKADAGRIWLGDHDITPLKDHQRVGLAGERHRIAGTLPHGAQRALDVALALAAKPKLLLLDEPMAGMGPDESARMVALIESLRSEMAILLIEHDMDAVFRLANRLTVLVQGKVLMTGTADEVRGHLDVQAVYLGTEAEGHS